MAQHDPDQMSDDELFANWAGWITRTAGELTEVFQHRYPLLTGKSMPEPTPAIQFDWEDAFRHPWMPPEVAERINAADQAQREAKSQAVLDEIKNRRNVE